MARNDHVELAGPLVDATVHVIVRRLENVLHRPAGQLLTRGKRKRVHRAIPASHVHDTGATSVDHASATDPEHPVGHVLAARLDRAEVLVPQHLARRGVERVEVSVLRALVDDVLRPATGTVTAAASTGCAIITSPKFALQLTWSDPAFPVPIVVSAGLYPVRCRS